MGYYIPLLFFCATPPAHRFAFCTHLGPQDMPRYPTGCLKQLNLSGEGKVRITNAGCLDRCSEGPVMVVYPDNVWYTYVDKADIDEIISEHLQNGRIVERLKI